jgi:hypothetical protein
MPRGRSRLVRHGDTTRPNPRQQVTSSESIMRADIVHLNSHRRCNLQGATMRLLSQAAVICAFVVMSLAAAAEPPSATAPPKAPGATESAGTAESAPRASELAPNSAEEAAVQERLTIFNSKQDLLDAEFDRKLKICRGC